MHGLPTARRKSAVRATPPRRPAPFLEGRGRATVNVVYNGEMPDSWFRFPITPVLLDAYTTIGGILSYDVTPNVTAYVRAENIFNAQYEEVFSYRAAGAAAYVGIRTKMGY